MSLINDALKRANEAQKNRPTAGPLGAPLQPADVPTRRGGGGGGGTNWMTVIVPVAIVLLLGLAFWFIRSGMNSNPQQAPVVAVTSPVPAAPKPVVAPAPTPAPVAVHPPVAPAAPKAPEKSGTYVAKNGIKVNTEVVTRDIPAPAPTLAKTEPVTAVSETAFSSTSTIASPATTVSSATTLPTTTPTAPAVTASLEMKAQPKTEPVVPAAPAISTPAVTTPAPPVTAAVPTPAPAPQTVVTKTETPKPVFPELKLQGIFYRLNNPSALISGKNVRVGDNIRGAKVLAIERESVTLDFKGERKTLNLDVQ